jgi:hypothetical protein
MDTQHSPRPWRVTYGKGTLHISTHNSQGYIATLTSPANIRDANLIAAAPDLLEALEALDKALPNFIFDPVLVEFVSVWGDKVVPAIKKAKGA